MSPGNIEQKDIDHQEISEQFIPEQGSLGSNSGIDANGFLLSNPGCPMLHTD
jgi:hypothetical protein